MPQVMSWNPPALPQPEMIAACVRALKAGQLVGIGCESCYFVVADPDNKKAMAKLQQLVGPNPKLPIVMGHDASDRPDKIVAGAGMLARRMSRRSWPGPIVINTATDKKGPMVPRYAPNSGAARQLIQAMGKPLAFGAPRTQQAVAPESEDQQSPAGVHLFAAAKGKDESYPSTAARLNELVGEHLAVILDAGPSPYCNIPSMIEINGNQFRIPVIGVVPEKPLAEQTAWLIVFVCTGNTCRSPLAEVLCKKMLAEKLNCSVEDLVERGFRVMSMGLSAMPGNTATSEALIVAREFKSDLSAHRSRPIEPELLDMADYVVAMTGIHRDSIMAVYPNVAESTRLLCGNKDLSDPIGSDLENYRNCGRTIEKQLERLITELLTAGQPTQAK